MADINVGAISEALNNKADLDLHNLNNEGKKSVTLAGMVMAFAGTSAPAGWLKCDGSAISRTTYSALFNVIGTTYGAGDGSTTFNLPTQSVLPLGQSASVSVFGTGKTLSITNGSKDYGLSFGTTSAWGLRLNSSPTANVGAAVSETSITTNKALGVSTNASNSGLKGTVNLAAATGAKAIACIKY